jgi:hypothetical protein
VGNSAGKALHLEDALRRECGPLQPARWNQQGQLLDASIEHIPRKKPKTLLQEQGTLSVRLNWFDLEQRHALLQSRAWSEHSCLASLDRTYVPAFPSDFRHSIYAICESELKICIIITTTTTTTTTAAAAAAAASTAASTAASAIVIISSFSWLKWARLASTKLAIVYYWKLVQEWKFFKAAAVSRFRFLHGPQRKRALQSVEAQKLYGPYPFHDRFYVA